MASNTIWHRNMVCYRYVIVNTLHKGDNMVMVVVVMPIMMMMMMMIIIIIIIIIQNHSENT